MKKKLCRGVDYMTFEILWATFALRLCNAVTSSQQKLAVYTGSTKRTGSRLHPLRFQFCLSKRYLRVSFGCAV